MRRRNKSIEKQLWDSPLFIIILLVIIFFAALGIVKTFVKSQKIKAETAELQDKVVELKKENQDLASQKQYYSSPYFVEKEARLRLNMRKPGEKVVFIQHEDEINYKEQRKLNNEFLVNFLDWWDYFFKHE